MEGCCLRDCAIIHDTAFILGVWGRNAASSCFQSTKKKKKCIFLIYKYEITCYFGNCVVSDFYCDFFTGIKLESLKRRI